MHHEQDVLSNITSKATTEGVPHGQSALSSIVDKVSVKGGEVASPSIDKAIVEHEGSWRTQWSAKPFEGLQ